MFDFSKRILSEHGRAMMITFEVFWIVVFLLDRVGGQSAGGIPPFVYVNF